jgi:hypothetical protein
MNLTYGEWMKFLKFKLKNKVSMALTLLTLSTFSYGSALRLIDFLAYQSGVKDVLSRVGVRGEAQKQVSNYVTKSIYVLSSSKKEITPKSLRQLITNLGVSPEDEAIKKRLLAKLNKVDSKITKEDVTSAINDLIYLSSRHGSRSTAIMACTQCVSESLAKHNFKYTFDTLKNKESQNVLKFMIPRNSKSLSLFVKNNLRKKELNFGGFTSKSITMIAKDEEKAMALFLGLARQGNATQKAYVEAVRNISTDLRGQVYLLNPKNAHKLWKVPSTQISDEKLKKLTKLLNEVAVNSRNSVNKKEVFFSLLSKRAGDDPSLKRRVKILKDKDCFFQ